MVQTVAEGSTIADVVSQILSIFTTVMGTATDIVTNNWVVFLSVGLPIVAGVVFAIIHSFKK